MSKLVSCPVDGCDYTGPHKSVLGHYSGKSDGLHPGGYQKAKSLLETDSEPASEPDEPESDPQEEPESTTESTGSNPTFGSAEPRPEPEPDSQPSQQPSDDSPEGEYVCLSCGGEVYDFSDYESAKMYEINGHSIMVAGDYQCSQCGEWFIDE
jgi:DNA-directed RNA polymerase subunit RPC12/RpoP